MTKLRPIHDRVIVKQHEVKTTPSGIILAKTTDKPLKGTVIAAGPGRWMSTQFIKSTLKPGDVVIFGNSVGEEIELDRETTILVMHESEILATIDE